MFEFCAKKGERVCINYSDEKHNFSWEPESYRLDQLGNLEEIQGIYLDTAEYESAIEIFNGKIGLFSEKGYLRIRASPERLASLQAAVQAWKRWAKKHKS